MPGTFFHLYIQIIFAVKGRCNLITPSIEEALYKYISGIINGKEQKSLAVNGMPDHIHLLVGLKPSMRISDLVRGIKNNSSNFINDNGWTKQKFSWQEVYGAFSYSQSNFGNVIEYIKNQKAHHKKKTFKEEYKGLLSKFDIPFENQYLFEFYD